MMQFEATNHIRRINDMLYVISEILGSKWISGNMLEVLQSAMCKNLLQERKYMYLLSTDVSSETYELGLEWPFQENELYVKCGA